jgi:EpsI family protein
MSSFARFSVVALFLMTAGIFVKGRPSVHPLPPHEPLESLPKKLDSWVGRNVPISRDELDVLGSGDFLLRVYRKVTPEPEISVFVAYIPTQQVGDTLHSPQNCLPGAGWFPLESGSIDITFPGRTTFPANRYLIGKNEERQLVLYWYSSHGRVLASEYWAKFFLVADSIRLNRSDGSLVRIMTPVVGNESEQHAEQRLLRFSQVLVPVLDDYIAR